LAHFRVATWHVLASAGAMKADPARPSRSRWPGPARTGRRAAHGRRRSVRPCRGPGRPGRRRRRQTVQDGR
jgi:hypothetical protein